MQLIFPYIFVFVTVSTAAISQLLVKYQMSNAGSPPNELWPKIIFLLNNLLTLPVIIAVILTFVSGISWMGALSKLSISQAYPFALLTFPIVVITSSIFFKDSLNLNYFIGMILMILGLILINK